MKLSRLLQFTRLFNQDTFEITFHPEGILSATPTVGLPVEGFLFLDSPLEIPGPISFQTQTFVSSFKSVKTSSNIEFALSPDGRLCYSDGLLTRHLPVPSSKVSGTLEGLSLDFGTPFPSLHEIARLTNATVKSFSSGWDKLWGKDQLVWFSSGSAMGIYHIPEAVAAPFEIPAASLKMLAAPQHPNWFLSKDSAPGATKIISVSKDELSYLSLTFPEPVFTPLDQYNALKTFDKVLASIPGPLLQAISDFSPRGVLQVSPGRVTNTDTGAFLELPPGVMVMTDFFLDARRLRDVFITSPIAPSYDIREQSHPSSTRPRVLVPSTQLDVAYYGIF